MVMLRLWRSARGHFVTLIKNGVQLLTCNAGHGFSRNQTCQTTFLFCLLGALWSAALIREFFFSSFAMKASAENCRSYDTDQFNSFSFQYIYFFNNSLTMTIAGSILIPAKIFALGSAILPKNFVMVVKRLPSYILAGNLDFSY